MNAEILCIGTELVLGDILNTNAQYLSKQLALKGINVFYQSSVGDNPERIIKALSIAVSRSNLIIFTGGLGPTADDITVSTVANALGIPLEKNQQAYEHILDYFKRTGKTPTKNNEKQAYLPKGSVVFHNEKGTAPGCAIESGNQCIVFLPGPPSEMQAMYENSLSDYLDKYATGTIKSKFVHIYGVGESKIDEMAKELIAGENPTVAPYAKDGEAELRVTAKSFNEASAEKMVDDTVQKIRNIFGNNIYGYDDDTLQSVVVKLLKSKNLTVATAESCTAGYISKRITDISGASCVFNMGVSTYSNECKTKELSVPADLIKRLGAVSPEVAACMAKGVRIKSGADIGLSITGIAGPKSDDSNKPVGLSYIGLSDKNGEYVIESMKGSKNDREYIRYTSASEALNFLRLYLENGNKKPENAMSFSAKLTKENPEAGKTEESYVNTEENAVKTEENSVKTEENSVKTEEATKIKEPEAVQEESVKKQVYTLNVQNPSAFASTDINAPDIMYAEEDESIVSESVSFEQIRNENNTSKNKTEDKELNIMIDDSYKEYEDEELALLDEQLELELKEKNKNKKKNGFLSRFLIHKCDTAGEIVRKIVFFVALIVFVIAAYNIAYYFINPMIQQSKLSEMAKEYHSYEAKSNYYDSQINPKFKSFYNKNNDLIGWITIDGTNIDYPVVQNEDSEFYMRKGFDKSYSREGSIFADKTSSIEYKNESKNIMLYGHHMDSTGTMFKELDSYLSLEFYKKNPNIIFDTLYRDGEYKVFAVFITNALPSQDNGNFYDYRKTEFSSDKEFSEWINQARLRSVIDTGVEVSTTDEILTLQTCNDSFQSDGEKARLIVMARRVRNGEDSKTDTSKAVDSKNPKYPQMWYDTKGLVNPYLETETEVTTKTEKTAKSNKQ